MFKTCMTQLNTTGFLVIEPNYLGELLQRENMTASQVLPGIAPLNPVLAALKGLESFFCLLDGRKGQIFTYSDELLVDRVFTVSGRKLLIGEGLGLDATAVLKLTAAEWLAHPLYPQSLDCERAKALEEDHARRVAAREAARLEAENAAS
ncbi:MAG: hypothetical protein ABL933_17365 [Methyloglobulus sp.]|nr:hypothetical protein [Methyloglobulus sp.]